MLTCPQSSWSTEAMLAPFQGLIKSFTHSRIAGKWVSWNLNPALPGARGCLHSHSGVVISPGLKAQERVRAGPGGSREPVSAGVPPAPSPEPLSSEYQDAALLRAGPWQGGGPPVPTSAPTPSTPLCAPQLLSETQGQMAHLVNSVSDVLDALQRDQGLGWPHVKADLQRAPARGLRPRGCASGEWGGDHLP